MSIFQFWADPVGWFVNNFTWWMTDPWRLTASNFLFWPLVFIKPWVQDRWELRQRRRRRRKEQMAV
jgi:hypothetical protein